MSDTGIIGVLEAPCRPGSVFQVRGNATEPSPANLRWEKK